MDYSEFKASVANTHLAPLIYFAEEDYLQQLKHGDFPRWRKHLKEFPEVTTANFDFGEVVKIGKAEDIDSHVQAEIKRLLLEMIPWRKGPFEVLGIPIDSEWKSNLKWARLAKKITSLTGKKILDIGCGNGYYGFRMLAQEPELVVGIDPHLAYVAQFWALKQFATKLPLHILPCALEQISDPLECFDSVFSMGVIYHRRSPIDHLLQCKKCLTPGGELVLETLYVDGPTGYSLIPEKRYARMSNVWFVPSIGTLEQWLTRCGFKNIQIVDDSTTTINEQRKTEWMPFASLEDALDKSDSSKTIEGSPAPKRIVVLANTPS
ncbi:MAG: tRNA 5-methoxyuridine(34)/uridine 5-oxyacetic acid(34) synthase CmoB [Pseudomonadales bacterium]|nr:tRNA 5-methoxyuridine(34)/uridine 5-oxyacetic acid(34) synthase CmoB [Pseudomonadales bacterium]